MNSRNLFYVRSLHLRFYFSKNKYIEALFYLEKFLFDNYNHDEEILISNLKQKWIYDCIEKSDYSNDITKKFQIIEQTDYKRNFLNLIESFSQIPSFIHKNKFIKKFEDFNKSFNLLLNIEDKVNLHSSVIFQLIYLSYAKKFKIDENIKKKLNFEKESIDFFESVFVDIFFKNHNYNITKIYYLTRLIYKVFRK